MSAVVREALLTLVEAPVAVLRSVHSKCREPHMMDGFGILLARIVESAPPDSE